MKLSDFPNLLNPIRLRQMPIVSFLSKNGYFQQNENTKVTTNMSHISALSQIILL